jgi:hypothetical protein
MSEWERTAEFKKALEDYEAREHKKAEAFDPKELLCRSVIIREVLDTQSGKIIRYGNLVFEDLPAIMAAETHEEKSIVILHRMLKKAYKDLTLDDVKHFEFIEATRILALMSGGPSFLQTQKQLQSGSEVTQQPKESASLPMNIT